MRRQPDTVKHPTQNAALFGYRRCREQRRHIGQQRRSGAQVNVLDKRRLQRDHQFLDRPRLHSVFCFGQQPISIQTCQALLSRLQLCALLVVRALWMQHRFSLADNFGTPLRRQGQQAHHIKHLCFDLICSHTSCFTGQPIIPRTAIIAIPATTLGCRRVIRHWTVTMLAVDDLREHPATRRATSQTHLPVFGSMEPDNRTHLVPGLLIDQGLVDSWQQLIVEFDESTIDRVLENDLQVPLVVQAASLRLNIVDPPATCVQFSRDRQIRVTPGRIESKCESDCFRIRARFQDAISAFLVADWHGTVPTPLLDFLPNTHHDLAAELVAEPFGQHALHLKVNNALWRASIDIIIEADQTHAECIEFCFYIQLQAQIAHEAIEIHDNQGANFDALLLDVVQQALKRRAPIVASADAFLDIDAGDIEATLCTERATLPFLCFQAVPLNLRLIGDSNVNSNKHGSLYALFTVAPYVVGAFSDESDARPARSRAMATTAAASAAMSLSRSPSCSGGWITIADRSRFIVGWSSETTACSTESSSFCFTDMYVISPPL